MRIASCLTLIAMSLSFLAPLACSLPAAGAEATVTMRPWNDYRTIMWIGDTAYRSPEKLPQFFKRLRELGINTAMVYGEADPQPVLQNQFPYYVENMVNRGLCLKYNSTVTDWDKFVTAWARNGRAESGLVRDYCLDDPAWLGTARQTVETIVRRNRENHPLAYNIRDELSSTISANPFDYDFNPIALEQFRQWLKQQYASLDALNAEWATDFKTWREVKPFTTDQVKNRMVSGCRLPKGQPDWREAQRIKFEYRAARQNAMRWNFAPWSDFRTYMDLALARALGQLRLAAHALDPATPVGIEGTQMPAAFGGYDLWRLSQALDWVEPYDIGGAREIFGSFMPGRPILTTVFESQSNPAARRLWHLLLEGDRGCLIWWSEDCIDWQTPGYDLTAKAKALQPVLHEMTSPLARLFLRAPREKDPIFLHYSQPSIQVDWLLESTVDGSTWLRRFSSFEGEHNQMAKTRVAWLKGLQDLGYSPQFICSEQLERGKLAEFTNALLVLPNSWSLSAAELKQIQAHLAASSSNDRIHRLLLEGLAGVFDEHGKLRAEPAEEALRQPGTDSTGCVAIGSGLSVEIMPHSAREYLAARLKPAEPSIWFDWLRTQLTGLPPEVSMPIEARSRLHRFAIASGRLLAVERNIEYQMSEDLKQAGGNQALEEPIQTEAVLRQPGHVYDLRTETYLGFTNRIAFKLDPWRPSLFAILREKAAAGKLLERLNREVGTEEKAE